MPKQVTLMRHAKSSWQDYSQSDMDRPLALRGKKDAPRMGRYLSDENLNPELVLCSPAQRTRETLARLQNTYPAALPVKFDQMIYSAGMGHGLIPLIHNLDANLSHVMIIGHNPAMQELALSLVNWETAGEGIPAKIQQKFSTGTIVSMTFEGDDWKSVNLTRGNLTHFAAPKMLG